MGGGWGGWCGTGQGVDLFWVSTVSFRVGWLGAIPDFDLSFLFDALRRSTCSRLELRAHSHLAHGFRLRPYYAPISRHPRSLHSFAISPALSSFNPGTTSKNI